MQTLDFNSVTKSTFPVVLKDKKKTNLTLICPTKEVAEAMQKINLPKSTEEEAYVCYYQTTALILSCNQERINFDIAAIKDMGMDIEDMRILIERYDIFIAEIFTGKN